MLGLALIALAAAPVEMPLSVRTSALFESPAWCRVMRGDDTFALPIVLEPYMAVSATVSPSGRWVVLGLGRKNKPLNGTYQQPDIDMMEGSYVLRLFQLKDGAYQYAKSFDPEGTWRFDAWSKDESKLLLVAGPMIRDGERQGRDCGYLLDTKTMKLRPLLQYDYITKSEFAEDQKSAIFTTLRFTNDPANDYRQVSTQKVQL